MLYVKTLAILASLFGCTVSLVLGGETIQAGGDQLHFPETINGKAMDPEILAAANAIRTADSQVAYLLTVLTNCASTNLADNQKCASAIRLLGHSGRTNVLGALVEHISFRDNWTGTYPCVEEVVLFREEAVGRLIQVIRESTSQPNIQFAVEALTRIKKEESWDQSVFNFTLHRNLNLSSDSGRGLRARSRL